jgi:rhodanese-related sulfurtransferase
MSRTISVQDVHSLLAAGNRITLIDARRKSDFDADPSTLPTAAWQDPEKTDEWSRNLPANKEVVLYCARGGSVSNAVLDRLLEKGIRARYLEGGIAAWKEAGNPVVKK